MNLTRVRVLGALDVQRGDVALPVGGDRARRVLAAIAARSGRSVRIETLADVAWDGVPPPSWRNTLQTYLSRYRSTLGIRIERRGDAYALDRGSCIVDSDEFEDRRRAGMAARAAGRWAAAETEFAAGLALWRGPAFDGLTDLDVIGPVAATLEIEWLDVVEGLVEAQLATGDPHAALVTSESAGEVPVGHERLACLRANALYQQGRAADAMRELATYRRRLADETGLLPSEAVGDLERLILEGRPAPRPKAAQPESSTLPAELARLRALPAVGRDDEIDAALQAWHRLAADTCHAWFVIGEAGAGKTRLAAEIAASLHERGWLVRYGRATERLDTAHQVFAQAFHDAHPDEVEEVGELRDELHGVVPHLVPRPPEREGSDDDLHREGFHEALGRLVAATAGDVGLLLVLDDLQWAAPPTLAAIEHLVTVSCPANVLILGVTRDDRSGSSKAAVRLAADLSRRAGAWSHELANLSPAAVAAMFKAHHLVLDADLTRRVARATGGNALLVTELVAVTESIDELRRRALDGDMSVPAAVAGLVRDRMSTLGDGGDVLTWAALVGTEFELALLERVAGDDVLDALEEAERVGLTREIGANRWEFRHGLTRDAVVQTVSRSRAAVRHAAIARALESLPSLTGTEGRVAYHWCQAAPAGYGERAVETSLIAARQCLDRIAPTEARSHVDRAVRLVGTDLRPDPATMARLHLHGARASAQLFDHGGRMSSAEDAYDYAQEAGDPALVVEAALLRNDFWTHGQFDQRALELLDGALALVGDDRRARADLLASMASMLALSGGVAEAVDRNPTAMAQEALELADELGSHGTWLSAAISMVLALWSKQDIARQAELARTMATRGGPDGPLLSARWIATPSLVNGDRDAFEAATARLRAIENRPDLDAIRAFGHQTACLSALLDARYDDAERRGAEAVAIARDHPNYSRVYAVQRFWIAAETDALESIEPLVRAAAENTDLRAFRAMLGLLLVHTGQLGEARAVLDELAGDRFSRVPGDVIWMGAIAACSEVAAAAGADEHVTALTELLQPYSGQIVVVAGGAFVYGAVDRFLAMLAAASGNRHEAAGLFERAAMAERALRAPPVEARTLVEWIRNDVEVAPWVESRLDELCTGADLPWAARMAVELRGGKGNDVP